MKCLLIVNPESGTKRIKDKCVDVIKEMNLQGWDVNVCVTLVPGDIEDIVISRKGTFDIAVCCGGDGTLKQTVAAVKKGDIDCHVGYIPCGTTNDFANGLGLSLDITAAAEQIVSGSVHLRDYGVFNDSGFMYTASFGMFTESSYSASQEAKNAFGNMAYLMEALKDITNIRSYHCAAVIDETTIEDDFVYGGVSNSSIVAGGVLKFDNAVADDGLFEVLLVRRPNSLLTFNEVIFGLLDPSYKTNMIIRMQAGRVKLQFDTPVAFTLDGEYGGEVKDVNIKVKPKEIKMVY